MGASKQSSSASLADIEDLIHNFLIIMLEHSMRQKDGWKTQVIAAAADGVAAEGLSPQDAKAEAQNAAQLSVALVENAIMILMLVEDHLRLQSKLSCASRMKDVSPSPLSLVAPINNRSSSLPLIGEAMESLGDRRSSIDSRGVPLNYITALLGASVRHHLVLGFNLFLGFGLLKTWPI
ncbi:hypothetical protein Dsin_026269 [Dipteronia sinensis]|uniref:Uncharacterized protein n=1 Tax=Dipteronia sinensis TaxID=43782 RepID=A0AAE0DZ42_9ROSI|nr:hypothetical protein Dsin_026269 [Dipteronia sinensis]